MLGRESGNSDTSNKFALVQNGSNVSILVDANEKPEVRLAADNLKIEIIPDLDKTLSGVTIFPQNVYPKTVDSIYLEYDVNIDTIGELNLHILVSPTLNFNGKKGLRYAVSFDGGLEQIVNINGYYDVKLMEKWEANSINEIITRHKVATAGKHTLRFKLLDPGIVLQKIMIDLGRLKNCYLGAPESEEFVGR